MPRRPDTPCARCGKLLWSGTTSRPAGERTCRDCRRTHGGPYARPVQPECKWCHREAEAPGGFCSAQCRADGDAHRNALSSKDRHLDRSPLRILNCVVCGQAFVSRRNRQRCIDHLKAVRPKQRISQREKNRRYSARKRGTTIEQFRDQEIHERDRWTCGLCGQRVDSKRNYPDPLSPSIDHILPLSKGGEHTRANVQCAHLGCNLAKGNDTVPQGEQLRLLG